jgi:CheY-like chemotaxis protein
LGLALVKQLVEMHGGRVEATSPGRGLGATFSVLLPRHDLDEDRAPEPDEAGRAALHGVRILAVEDQATLLEYLRNVLEEHGATVVAVDSAHRALSVLRDPGRQPFDLIISDLGLPELDGYELIRIVRNELNLDEGAVPALALTAYARDEDRIRALQRGYQAHLAKPYQVNELLLTLSGLMERRKGARA